MFNDFGGNYMGSLVSVIIPVFNTEKYISRCINSVLSQTYKDIEIICCDDGSTDGSYNVLLDFQSKYKNIQVLKNSSNIGQGKSRNKCISISNGKFLFFLDSDNYILPHSIERFVEFGEKYPKHIIISDMVEIDEFGYEIRKRYQNISTLDVLIKGNTIDMAALVEKDVFKDKKFYEYRILEDWDLWLTCLVDGYKFYKINEFLVYYTVRNNSSCRSRENICNIPSIEKEVRYKVFNWYANKKVGSKVLDKSIFDDPDMDKCFLNENTIYCKLKNEKKSDKCLVTIIDYDNLVKDSILCFYSLPHNCFKRYCKKYNLDYYIYVLPSSLSFEELMFYKFDAFNLVGDYNRVFYCDSDVLIKDDAENLFEIVPEDKIGMVIESRYSKEYYSFARSFVNFVNNVLGDRDFKFNDYCNAGQMLFSPSRHSELMKKPVNINFSGVPLAEQSYINYVIYKNNYEVFDLGGKYSVFSRGIEYASNNIDFEAKMIHFLGVSNILDKKDRMLLYFLKEDNSDFYRIYASFVCPQIFSNVSSSHEKSSFVSFGNNFNILENKYKRKDINKDNTNKDNILFGVGLKNGVKDIYVEKLKKIFEKMNRL